MPSNQIRRMIAHSSFEAAPDGSVQFGKTVTKDGRFQPVDPPWTETDFAKRYADMKALEADLDRLIALIKPVPFPPGLPWQIEWQLPQRRPPNPAIYEMSSVAQPVPLPKQP